MFIDLINNKKEKNNHVLSACSVPGMSQSSEGCCIPILQRGNLRLWEVKSFLKSLLAVGGVKVWMQICLIPRPLLHSVHFIASWLSCICLTFNVDPVETALHVFLGYWDPTKDPCSHLAGSPCWSGLLLQLWVQTIETLRAYVSYFKMLSVKILIKSFRGRPHLETVIQMLYTTLASVCQTAVQVMSIGHPLHMWKMFWSDWELRSL